MPKECGCDAYASGSWGSDAAGLMAVGNDLGRTQGCGKNFEASIQAYGQDLKKLGDAVTQVQQALGLSQKEGLPKLVAAVTVMKTSAAKIQEFGKGAESAKTALKGCPDTFKKAGELLLNAPEQEKSKLPKTNESSPLGIK